MRKGKSWALACAAVAFGVSFHGIASAQSAATTGGWLGTTPYPAPPGQNKGMYLRGQDTGTKTGFYVVQSPYLAKCVIVITFSYNSTGVVLQNGYAGYSDKPYLRRQPCMEPQPGPTSRSISTTLTVNGDLLTASSPIGGASAFHKDSARSDYFGPLDPLIPANGFSKIW